MSDVKASDVKIPSDPREQAILFQRLLAVAEPNIVRKAAESSLRGAGKVLDAPNSLGGANAASRAARAGVRLAAQTPHHRDLADAMDSGYTEIEYEGIGAERRPRERKFNTVEARLREWARATVGAYTTKEHDPSRLRIPPNEGNRLNKEIGSDDFDKKYGNYLDGRLYAAVEDAYILARRHSEVIRVQDWTRRRLIQGPVVQVDEGDVLRFTRDATDPNYIQQNEPGIALFQQLVRAVFLYNKRMGQTHYVASRNGGQATDVYAHNLHDVLAQFARFGMT